MRVYFIDDNAIFLLGIVFLLFLVFGLLLSQGVPNGVASKGDTALLNNSSGQITQFPIMSVPCFFLVVSFYHHQNPNFPKYVDLSPHQWRNLRILEMLVFRGDSPNDLHRQISEHDHKRLYQGNLTERKNHHGWTTLPNQSTRKSRLHSNLKVVWTLNLFYQMYFMTRKCSFVLNQNSIP